MAGDVRINIRKFWTIYKPNPADPTAPKAVDMVEYHPIGMAQRTATVCTVASLGKLHPIEMAMDNPAIKAAHQRWAIIEPAYRAWKHNQDVPINGTPLGAWPGVSHDQAEALRMMGIRTVEEVRDASDGIVTKFPFSGGRELRVAADAYLKSADRNKVSADISNLTSENVALKEQIEELRAMILESKSDDTEDAPKRRGRPPKDQAAA